MSTFEYKLKESETPRILHLILSGAIPKMRVGGDDELKIAQQSYEFAAQQLRLTESRHVIYVNQIVAKAIEEMAFLGQWSNLASIAKHAMDEAQKTCVRLADEDVRLGANDRLHRDMAEFYALDHEFLRTGMDGYADFARKLVKFAEDKREAETKRVRYTRCVGEPCVYSRTMNQEYPRKCLKCNVPEDA
jgi:hypothetical protein